MPNTQVMSLYTCAKKMLAAFLLVIAASSCSKNAVDAPSAASNPTNNHSSESKFHKVNFKLGSFEVDFSKINGKQVAAKDYLTYLFYIVYDSSGNLVNKQERNFLNENFGEVTDSLKNGNYTIVFAGSSDPNYFVRGTFAIVQLTYNKLSTLQLFNGFWNGDLFYNKMNLTIKDSDTTVNNLTLNRISGNLQITLKDPSSLYAYATAHVTNFPSSLNVLNETLNPFDTTISVSNLSSHYPFNMTANYFGSNSKLKIVIRAYNSKDEVIKERVIDSLFVYPNKKTVLTGRLFPPPEEENVTIPITVEPDLADSLILNF